MIFIGEMYKKGVTCYRRLRSEVDNWQTAIRYSLRFILCGIFSFFAFEILSNLSKIDSVKINTLVEHLFEKFPLFLTVLMIVVGYVGLGFSLIAAALFRSLLPREEKNPLSKWLR